MDAWPALMRPDTLKAYLDCRSDSDFARKLKELERRGYPGMDPFFHRHIKDVVDRYFKPDTADREKQKADMRKAARGEVAA